MNILFEDEYLLAVDKPSGLAIHRGWARDDVTLVDLVREHTSKETAYPVSRLDRGASGVVLFAKGPDVARALQSLLAPPAAQSEAHSLEEPDRNPGCDGPVPPMPHTSQKTYWVLVRGNAPRQAVIDHPVPSKEGGADAPRVPAMTHVMTLATVQVLPRNVSWVQASLLTGRLHQIRRHMKHIGHPVLGDANYGRGDLNREYARLYALTRLALHSRCIQVPHPVTGRCLFLTSPLPEDLRLPMAAMGFEV